MPNDAIYGLTGDDDPERGGGHGRLRVVRDAGVDGPAALGALEDARDTGSAGQWQDGDDLRDAAVAARMERAMGSSDLLRTLARDNPRFPLTLDDDAAAAIDDLEQWERAKRLKHQAIERRVWEETTGVGAKIGSALGVGWNNAHVSLLRYLSAQKLRNAARIASAEAGDPANYDIESASLYWSGGPQTPERAAREVAATLRQMRRIQEAAPRIPPHPEVEAALESGSAGEMISALWNNPDVAFEKGLESAVYGIPSIVAGLATSVATSGAAAVPAAIAMGSVFGLTSAATERVVGLEEALIHILGEGYTDRDFIEAYLDPERSKEIVAVAQAKGIGVGALAAFTGALGTRFLAPATFMGSRVPVVKRSVADWIAHTAIGIPAEGAGEALGQGLAYGFDNINDAEAILEMAASGPSAAIDATVLRAYPLYKAYRADRLHKAASDVASASTEAERILALADILSRQKIFGRKRRSTDAEAEVDTVLGRSGYGTEFWFDRDALVRTEGAIEALGIDRSALDEDPLDPFVPVSSRTLVMTLARGGERGKAAKAALTALSNDFLSQEGSLTANQAAAVEEAMKNGTDLFQHSAPVGPDGFEATDIQEAVAAVAQRRGRTEQAARAFAAQYVQSLGALAALTGQSAADLWRDSRAFPQWNDAERDLAEITAEIVENHEVKGPAAKAIAKSLRGLNPEAASDPAVLEREIGDRYNIVQAAFIRRRARLQRPAVDAAGRARSEAIKAGKGAAPILASEVRTAEDMGQLAPNPNWGIISATRGERPLIGKEYTEEETAQRTERLRAELTALVGAPNVAEVKGMFEGHSEVSFLVTNIDQRDLEILANRYEQDSWTASGGVYQTARATEGARAYAIAEATKKRKDAIDAGKTGDDVPVIPVFDTPAPRVGLVGREAGTKARRFEAGENLIAYTEFPTPRPLTPEEERADIEAHEARQAKALAEGKEPPPFFPLPPFETFVFDLVHNWTDPFEIEGLPETDAETAQLQSAEFAAWSAQMTDLGLATPYQRAVQDAAVYHGIDLANAPLPELVAFVAELQSDVERHARFRRDMARHQRVADSNRSFMENSIATLDGTVGGLPKMYRLLRTPLTPETDRRPGPLAGSLFEFAAGPSAEQPHDVSFLLDPKTHLEVQHGSATFALAYRNPLRLRREVHEDGGGASYYLASASPEIRRRLEEADLVDDAGGFSVSRHDFWFDLDEHVSILEEMWPVVEGAGFDAILIDEIGDSPWELAYVGPGDHRYGIEGRSRNMLMRPNREPGAEVPMLRAVHSMPINADTRSLLDGPGLPSPSIAITRAGHGIGWADDQSIAFVLRSSGIKWGEDDVGVTDIYSPVFPRRTLTRMAPLRGGFSEMETYPFREGEGSEQARNSFMLIETFDLVRKDGVSAMEVLTATPRNPEGFRVRDVKDAIDFVLDENADNDVLIPEAEAQLSAVRTLYALPRDYSKRDTRLLLERLNRRGYPVIPATADHLSLLMSVFSETVAHQNLLWQGIGGMVRLARMAPRLTSVEEAKAHGHILTHWRRDQHEMYAEQEFSGAIEDAVQNGVDEPVLMRAMKSYARTTGQIEMIRQMKELREAEKASDYDAAGDILLDVADLIFEGNETYHEQLPDQALEVARAFLDLMTLDTNFFEAKPYRTVPFEDIALAIVPENMYDEVHSKLSPKGVEVRSWAAYRGTHTAFALDHEGTLFQRARVGPLAEPTDGEWTKAISEAASLIFPFADLEYREHMIATAGGDATGMFRWGSRMRPLLTVVRNAKALRTLGHEGFHALQEGGFFTAKEWEVLRREAEANWLGKARKLYRDLDRETQILEAMAMAYEENMRDSTIFAGREGGVIKMIFERIRLFMRQLGYALANLGFREGLTAARVFDAIDRGQVGSRTFRREWADKKEEGALYQARGPFYSEVRRALEKGQKRAYPRDWLKYIQSPKTGLKSTELNTLYGMTEALRILADDPETAESFLSREDLIKLYDDHEVAIENVVFKDNAVSVDDFTDEEAGLSPGGAEARPPALHGRTVREVVTREDLFEEAFARWDKDYREYMRTSLGHSEERIKESMDAYAYTQLSGFLVFQKRGMSANLRRLTEQSGDIDFSDPGNDYAYVDSGDVNGGRLFVGLAKPIPRGEKEEPIRSLSLDIYTLQGLDAPAEDLFAVRDGKLSEVAMDRAVETEVRRAKEVMASQRGAKWDTITHQFKYSTDYAETVITSPGNFDIPLTSGRLYGKQGDGARIYVPTKFEDTEAGLAEKAIDRVDKGERTGRALAAAGRSHFPVSDMVTWVRSAIARRVELDDGVWSNEEKRRVDEEAAEIIGPDERIFVIHEIQSDMYQNLGTFMRPLGTTSKGREDAVEAEDLLGIDPDDQDTGAVIKEINKTFHADMGKLPWYGQSNWALIGFKTALDMAIAKDLNWIAIADGPTQAYMETGDEHHGMKFFYDKIIPDAIAKYFKRMGWELDMKKVPLSSGRRYGGDEDDEFYEEMHEDERFDSEVFQRAKEKASDWVYSEDFDPSEYDGDELGYFQEMWVWPTLLNEEDWQGLEFRDHDSGYGSVTFFDFNIRDLIKDFFVRDAERYIDINDATAEELEQYKRDFGRVERDAWPKEYAELGVDGVADKLRSMFDSDLGPDTVTTLPGFTEAVMGALEHIREQAKDVLVSLLAAEREDRFHEDAEIEVRQEWVADHTGSGSGGPNTFNLIRITPEMKEAVKEDGQPRFQRVNGEGAPAAPSGGGPKPFRASPDDFWGAAAQHAVVAMRDADARGMLSPEKRALYFSVLGVEWWGAVGPQEIRALGALWETYADDGELPEDANPAARDMLQSLTAHIVSAYQNELAATGGLPGIDRGVREIMEAMSVGFAAVEDVSKTADFPLAFGDAETGAMTPAEYREYVRIAQSSVGDARMKAVSRLMSDVARARTEARREERPSAEAEARERVVADPVWAAILRLRNNIDIETGERLDTARIRLDTADVRDLVGTAALERFPPSMVSPPGKQGVDAAVVAELYGFGTATELLDAISLHIREDRNGRSVINSLQQEIRRVTDEILDEREGTALDGATVRREAEAALSERDRSALLAMELSLMTERGAGEVARKGAEREVGLSGPVSPGAIEEERAEATERALSDDPEESAQGTLDVVRAGARGRASESARRMGRGLIGRAKGSLAQDLAVVRARAVREVAGMTVSEIEGSLTRLRQKQVTASREAALAVARQDWEAASGHKRAELDFHHTTLELTKAKDALAKFNRLAEGWRKLDRKTARRRAHEYLEPIRELLAINGYGRTGTDPGTSAALVRTFVDAANDAGHNIFLPDDVLAPKTFMHMTYDELLRLHASLKSLTHAAGVSHRLSLAAWRERMSELADAIAANKPARIDRELLSRFRGRARDMWDEFTLSHRKMEHLFRELDGMQDQGPVWTALFRPVNSATDAEIVMRQQVMEGFLPVWEYIERKGRSLRRNKRMVAGLRLTDEERLVIALNWGNAGNRDALLNGSRDWTEDQLREVVNSLSDEEWDFVESAWAVINSLWEPTRQLERRVSGTEPMRVEPDPFVVATESGDRTMAGSYYPILFDPKLSSGAYADNLEQRAKEMMTGAVAKGATRQGRVIERRGSQGSGKRVWMSLDGIFRHLDDAIHDITHREAVLEINRIVNDRDFSDALTATYGVAARKYIEGWIRAVAAGNIEPIDGVDVILKHLRIGMSVAEMGFSLRTTIVQPLGITQTVARIGIADTLAGMGHFLGHAKGNPFAQVEWVNARSPYMATRSKSFDREISDASRGLKATKQLDILKSSAFWMIGKVDMMVAYSTWFGSYKAAMREGKGEGEAIEFADQVVRETQSSALVKDLAAVARGGEKARMLTAFYTYFSAMQNMIMDANESTKVLARTQGKVTASLYGASQFFWLIALPALLAEVVLNSLGPDEREGDEPGAWAAWAAKAIVGYGFGGLVLVRDVAQGATSEFGFGGPAVMRALETGSKVARSVSEAEIDRELLKQGLMAMGYMAHLPARQTWRLFEGIDGWAEGDLTFEEAVVTGMGGHHFRNQIRR